MRDCLNVPGSLPRSSGGTRANVMFDLEPPQTALGECMVNFGSFKFDNVNQGCKIMLIGLVCE